MNAVVDTLEALRRDLPGCGLVAYGDLDARLVLASSAADTPPREVLDALCLAAHTCLDGKGAQAVAHTLGLSHLTEASALTGGRLALFLRSQRGSADALFCLFDAQADPDPTQARRLARNALERLEAMT